MTPRQVLEKAEGLRLVNEDGVIDQVKLLPPLSGEELRDLEGMLPCPLPQEARDLFAFSRGYEGGALEVVDLSGITYDASFGWDEIFPCPIPIAHDGFGNFWVIDMTPSSTAWNPIFYVLGVTQLK